MLIRGENFNSLTLHLVSIVCQINDSSNPIACFIRNENFDPKEAYKRGTLLRAYSYQLNQQPRQVKVKSSSPIRSFRAIPLCRPSVFLANSQSEPVKKVSSVMVVSVGNTASVAPEYASLIIAMQSKTVLQLTGAVQHATSLSRSLLLKALLLTSSPLSTIHLLLSLSTSHPTYL